MIFKDTLKRKLFYLTITCIITIIVILLSEIHNRNVEAKYDIKIENQDSRRLISKSISEKLVYLEKELYRLTFINNKKELEKAKKTIFQLLQNIEININILKKGGQLRYFKESSDKATEWDKLPYYYPENELKNKNRSEHEIPNLNTIWEIITELITIIDLPKDYSKKEEFQVNQLLNQVFIAINNCQENISLINRDINDITSTLKFQKTKMIHFLKTFRIIFIFLTVSIGSLNFKKTTDKIGEIVTERDLYTLNIKSMNVILTDKQNFITSVLNSVSVGIIVVEVNSQKIIDINEAALGIMKIRYDDIINKKSSDIFKSSIIFSEDQEKMSSYHEIETEIADANGENISILMSSIITKLNERICRVINFMDISNLKKAEQALRASEQLNRAVIENSPIGISVRDKFGTLMIANDSWRKIWGVNEEIFQKDKIKRKRLKFNDRDSYLGKNAKKVENVYLHGGELYIPEIKIDKKPGRKTEWIAHHFYAIQDENKKVDKVVILTEDISSRKETETILHEREIRYQTLIEKANDAIFLEDANGKIIDVNIQACKLTGLEKPDLVNKPINTLWIDAAHSNLGKYEDLKQYKDLNFESKIIHKSGKYIPVEKTIAPFADREDMVFLSIVRDITDRKKNELIQSVLFDIAYAANTTYNLQELYKIIHNKLGLIINAENFYIALYDKNTKLINVPYYVDKIENNIPPLQKIRTGLTAYIIKTKKSLLLTKTKRDMMVINNLIPDLKWESKLWLGVPLINQNNEVIGAMAALSYEDDELYNEQDLRILEFVSGQIAVAIERKKAENRLRESEEIIRTFMDSATDSMSIWDKHGVLVEMNTISLQMLNTQKTISELIGDKITNIIPAFNKSNVFKRCLKVLKDNKPLCLDYVTELQSNGKHYFALKAFKVTDNLGVIISDITGRKISEEKIKSSLKEKEVMLKEIHHRVKNNMQVISSLLNLQSGYIVNEQDRDLFRESQNRVKSMSLIHEKLYQSQNLASIDFREYVKNLTRHLYITFGINISKIKLNIDIEDIFLNVNFAIPCGLIINELVSNSLKYAFPNDNSGNIFIKLNQKDGVITITVGDNGIGLPENINIEKSDSLGLQLVHTLSMQIDSKIIVERKNGTSFTIIFNDIS